VPVLLLAGDRDSQLAAIGRTADHLPAATLIELPDCRHLDTSTRADLTLPLALPFLANHTGGPWSRAHRATFRSAVVGKVV